MPERSFDLGPYGDDDDPIVFSIAGETFTCKPNLPAWAVVDLRDNGLVTATGLIRFLNRVLVPEDRVRFGELVASDEVIIETRHLDEIVAWLFEVYTGRPTQPPAASPNGRPTGGNTSPESSSLRVIEPKTSASGTS